MTILLKKITITLSTIMCLFLMNSLNVFAADVDNTDVIEETTTFVSSDNIIDETFEDGGNLDDFIVEESFEVKEDQAKEENIVMVEDTKAEDTVSEELIQEENVEDITNMIMTFEETSERKPVYNDGSFESASVATEIIFVGEPVAVNELVTDEIKDESFFEDGGSLSDFILDEPELDLKPEVGGVSLFPDEETKEELTELTKVNEDTKDTTIITMSREIVQTGDETNIVFYLVLLTISTITFVLIILRNSFNKKQLFFEHNLNWLCFFV